MRDLQKVLKDVDYEMTIHKVWNLTSQTSQSHFFKIYFMFTAKSDGRRAPERYWISLNYQKKGSLSTSKKRLKNGETSFITKAMCGARTQDFSVKKCMN